jgi:hypothetical protein
MHLTPSAAREEAKANVKKLERETQIANHSGSGSGDGSLLM